ncbi:hypothetical protein EG829_33040, partial [bacterium]|nr:hypothetical protein [bacterium]
ESAHGLCRAKMECIDADIVEFAKALRTASDATAAKDPGTAGTACERLAEIYRGELLPGDVYDDWFSSARDRYRRQFGDAILETATMLVASGHPARAAGLARHGIEADSWREDLYQVLLRAQINNGQRSAAIDTYMSCRAKLADELGLDPSSETVLLYEEVLAMEEQGPVFGAEKDSD